MKHSNMIKTYNDELINLRKKKDELVEQEIDTILNPPKKDSLLKTRNRLELQKIKE